MGATTCSNLKPMTLELGSKSPMIICKDADIDVTVELAHFALFFNMGQCCCTGSRTFVHESIYDEFVEKSKMRAFKRVVGDPFMTGVEQGPQVDKEPFHKVLGYIESGHNQGANLLTGRGCLGKTDYYIKPTIFTDVTEGMKIFDKEIFGLVQSITKFKTLEEVVHRANNTVYGLAAGIFSNNLNTVNTLSRALRAGTIWVNCFDVFDATIPFGGYKQSSIGREKGKYALESTPKSRLWSPLSTAPHDCNFKPSTSPTKLPRLSWA